MRVDVVHCDCCKNQMKNETENSLEGQLFLSGVPALDHPGESVLIEMEDICDGCAEALLEAIELVRARRRS